MYIQTGDRQVAEFITQDTVFSVVVLLLNCLDINIQILTLLLAYWMYGGNLREIRNPIWCLSP